MAEKHDHSMYYIYIEFIIHVRCSVHELRKSQKELTGECTTGWCTKANITTFHDELKVSLFLNVFTSYRHIVEFAY